MTVKAAFERFKEAVAQVLPKKTDPLPLPSNPKHKKKASPLPRRPIL
jgi:hypothetical protein